MPNELLATYVDCCRELGLEPPRRVVGNMAKEIKTLIDEGQPREQIELGLRLCADKGGRPSELPNFLVEAARRQAREPLAKFVSEHGWPTGAKLIRGTHGVAHVPDPLGTDRPPAGWPHERPGRHDVEQALATHIDVSDG